jgi:V/A-type H+-transporting ATPase subunit C
MLAEMKYGAISGKSRAMYGKLLKNDDYAALIQKKSVSDVVSYLKNNTHYNSVLSEVDEKPIHRSKLENILRCDLVNDYGKLLKFSNGRLKEFINMMYAKIEIENLKIIFRVFEAGHFDQIDLEDSLIFSAFCGRVNIQKMALSRNLKDFVSELKGTVYYDALRPFISESNETRLFDLEMALDQFYLRNFLTHYKKLLSGIDRDIAKEFIGLESDIFNIFWIYRSKIFYHMDEQVIRSYTLPLEFKLTKKTMEALIKAESFEEYIGILSGTAYGFLFDNQHELLFERNYSELMYRTYKSRFRRYPFSIASIISYLRLKEMELSNIVTIIEGIRYQLSEADIRKYVVGQNV